jgi:hypothetical protein
MSLYPASQELPLDQESPPQRRRWMAPVIGAVVGLLLALPLVVYLGFVRDGDQAAAPPPPVPTPTTSAAPSPSAPPAPDGRIPYGVLANARFFIPGWPADNVVCPAGRIKLTDGTYRTDPYAPETRLIRTYYADVDDDLAEETLALLNCSPAEDGSLQLLALDRDAAGAITTMGRVVATTGAVRVIDDDGVQVDSSGTIRVRVGDYYACCGEDGTVTQWQVRRYGWNGGGFDQTGGPVTFPQNPRMTDLAVAAQDVVLGPAADGRRTGVLRFTVRLREPAVPHHLGLRIDMPPDVRRDGPGWSGCRVEPAEQRTILSCEAPPPILNHPRAYTYRLSRAAAATGGEIHIYVLGYASASDLAMHDRNDNDNQASAPILVPTTAQ